MIVLQILSLGFCYTTDPNQGALFTTAVMLRSRLRYRYHEGLADETDREFRFG